MGKRIALIFLTAAAPLVLVSFVVAGPLTPTLFAALAAIFPASLMAVGAADRGGRLGRAAMPVLGLTVLLPLVMAGLFVFRGAGLDVPWWGGLPAGAAIQIYGLFLLPFGVASLGYAWAFEESGLRQDDLDALRRRFPESLEVGAERVEVGAERVRVGEESP